MEKRQFNIYGRVQGVGFRFFTLQQAKQLGVKGYVKNCADGSVLAVVEGNETQLAEMREWFKQGSPSAKVTRLLEQPYQGEQEFERFNIERSLY